MNDIRSIPVDSLVRREDARTQDEAAISALAESIAETGLMNPLTVRPLADDRFEIIAGSHRFTACDLLEWPEIPCHVVVLDDTLAELAMIDENLCRAELKGALRDQQTARRKVIYERLYPDSRHGTPGVSRQVGDTGGRSQTDRFTAETAAITGHSERTIQRSAERGEKIAREAANLMAGTHLDTGSYADRIKNRPADEQVETVRRDLATPPPPRQQSVLARPAPKPRHEPGEAFTRFLQLADDLEAIGVPKLLEAAKGPGPTRAKLGQRAGDLGQMMDDIAQGLG